MNRLKGTLILLVTAIVWGMAFAAQSSAADSIGTFTFNASRSVLAAVFLLAVIGIRKITGIGAKKSANAEKPVGTVRGGLICGVLLFIAINLQQAGIAAYPADAAASGRAGFLTATYVIMVALLAKFTHKKLHPTVIVATIGCIIGMYMLCMSCGFSILYFGDVLVLLCAVAFTFHVMTIDYFSKADGLKMSCIQFSVCAVLSFIPMLIFENPSFEVLRQAWIPVVYAGVFSGGVGYTLQIEGQKYAEPSVATIVMSLESVFAALAGWLILNERLSTWELCGCALVFCSVILAQFQGFSKSNQLPVTQNIEKTN